MKLRTIVFILFCVINPYLIKAQWYEIITNTNITNMNCIYFINDSTGFIGGTTSDTISSQIGHSGIVYKTTDWGQTWDTVFITSLSTVATAFSPASIFFTTPLTGYIVGNGSRILRTFDGGNNWIIEPFAQIPNNNTITKIHFTDTLTGYMCTQYKFFKTTDGGTNWNFVGNIGSPDFSFPTENVSYLLGFKTQDAWNSWTTFTGDGISGNCIAFINDTIGIVGGMGFDGFPNFNYGSLLRTTDGAQTWTRNDFNQELGSFAKVQFMNSSNGYLIGGGNSIYRPFWKTIDAGLSWYQQEVIYSGTYTYIADCLHCPSQSVCYVGGNKKNIYKTTNGGGPLIGLGIGEKTNANSFTISPNPTQKTLNITTKNKYTQATIYDLQGSIVLNQNYSHQIDVSSLNNGMYILELSNNNESIRKRFVKQ